MALVIYGGGEGGAEGLPKVTKVNNILLGHAHTQSSHHLKNKNVPHHTLANQVPQSWLFLAHLCMYNPQSLCEKTLISPALIYPIKTEKSSPWQPL